MFSRNLRLKRCELTSLLRNVTSGKWEETEKRTHFGFEEVSEREKSEKVYKVFENVAKKYDLMNDVMSFGVHRCWKDQFVRTLNPVPGCKVLDVAGGTGDIAFRIVDRLRSSATITDKDSSKPKTNVVVCDINEAMLNVGKENAKRLHYDQDVSWLQGDAENLPVEDGSFHAYTIAFGIRNVVRIDKAIDEAYRVLCPGGRFLCLEFSHVESPLPKWLYDNYSFQVIPVLGQLIARDWKSYQYLVESIRQFPAQKQFCDMIQRAGFAEVTFANLSSGIAAIHSGFKL